MTKAEQKLDEIKSHVEELQNETKKRVDNLNQLIGNLRNDIQTSKEKQDKADEKIGSLKNEITLLEGNINDENQAIGQLQSKLEEINPKLEENKSKQEELNAKISELSEKKDNLDQEISQKEQNKENLTQELDEKQNAFSDLEASIEKDLEKYKVELDDVKEKHEEMLENNLIWDYLFDKIETPEIEIMAIIAANRGISQDDIKSKASNVSPVFVGRAISKLEADGKIINKNNGWDLSPAVLEAIE